MVTTLLKSTLREIRQSLGRYLAILAIVGLGVGVLRGAQNGSAGHDGHRSSLSGRISAF